MSFDLFRLPQLASMNIIRGMNTTEQFLMSLCSRRTFSIIKTLRGKSENIRMVVDNITLLLIDGDEELTSFQHVMNPGLREKVTVNGHPTFLTHNKRKTTIKTYWAEPIVGTMELIEHVSNLFGIHVKKVAIKPNWGTRLMNWVQQRQGSLRMVSINSFDSKFESKELKSIIMECEAKYVRMNALHSTPFEIQDLHKAFETFECLNGTWITVDNLITLDCIQITVLQLELTEENDAELFDGLNGEWRNGKTVVYDHHPHDGFFEIVRGDGITSGFKFFAHKFLFAVWPSDNQILLDLDALQVSLFA